MASCPDTLGPFVIAREPKEVFEHNGLSFFG
jgi:hypothetical protein